ncbi:hypothetical protein UlMin_023906 [Ulmus minor]
MIQNSVQFGGLANDDPNLHIANFLEICDTFKHNGATDDAIRLRLFPFSLNSKAKESLYKVWERYKDLLRKCPHHGLPLWMQVQTFYNGLLPNTQTMVDVASGGVFFNKTPEDGYELIEVMASNNFLKSTDRNAQKRTAGVHDIDAFNKLAAQVALLNNNFKNLNISKLLAARTQGALPSNTEKNPREHANAISLRSGKELDPPKQVGQQVSTVVQPIQGATSDVKNQPNDSTSIPKSIPSSSTVPFPQRLRKQKLDNQFSKFLNIFKSLHINLPFVDMLEQMPKYVKFLKDILSNKRKLEECEAIALTEETTVLLQKKLPPKLKDPGSFSIPCTIGEKFHTKALCDLGVSINLMPLSIFRKLGLGEPTPTMVSLVMADRSIKHPRGIVEDVLVKVGKLIFPVDFIVLDMEEDKDIPIILGRPFLATGGAIIDVRGGKLTLQVDDEKVTFNVYGSMKLPQGAFGGTDMSDFNLYKQPP